MAKKIAVVIRGRADEALRMSLGLTLLDATVDIYALAGALDGVAAVNLHLESIRDLDMNLYTAAPEGADLAHTLLEYDHVIAY